MTRIISLFLILLLPFAALAAPAKDCKPAIKKAVQLAVESHVLKGLSLNEYKVLWNDPSIKPSGDVYFVNGSPSKDPLAVYISGITAYNANTKLGFASNLIVQFLPATCSTVLVNFTNFRILENL